MQMTQVSNTRNGTLEFAYRTRKNLDFVVRASRDGADIHPVTHTINSLLGIIVFPWERYALSSLLKTRLELLYINDKWPRWHFEGSKPVSRLGNLINYLRNAISHGSVSFSSDSKVLDEVQITFENDNWSATIRADSLVEFCDHFLATLQSKVA